MGMKTGYTVADAMSTRPITVPSTITVRDASKVMRDHNISSLLMVDDEQLVGIVIAEDIIHRVTAEGKPSDKTLIRDVMTKELVDIKPEADLYDAMTLMQEHDIFHLPVRDAQKRLIGFLTLKDLLRIEPQLFELMSEMAELSQNGPLHKAALEGFCDDCGNFSDSLVQKTGKRVCTFCADYH
jgi:CBS domain-containing protein